MQYTPMHNMQMTISEKLKREMNRVGVTQYSLEKLSTVPQPTIQRILKGSDPKASTIIKLANALGVPSSALLDDAIVLSEIKGVDEDKQIYDVGLINPSVKLLINTINSRKLKKEEIKLIEAVSDLISKDSN